MTKVSNTSEKLTEMLAKEVLESCKPIEYRVKRILVLNSFGANVNYSKYGKSMLGHAIFRGEEEIAKALKSKGAIEWYISEEESLCLGKNLLKEVIKDNCKEVQNLIYKGAKVDVLDDDNWSPLLVASSKGYTDIVKVLLNSGADVNIDNGDKMSALQAACRGGHLDIVKFLIDYGADVNKKMKNGKTALMKASSVGDVDIISLLIKNGADVNAQDEQGKSSLMYGLGSQERRNVVNCLLDNGARVNLAKKDGETVLMRASIIGDSVLVRELLNRGANVYLADKRGETVMDKMKFFYSSEKIAIWSMLEDAVNMRNGVVYKSKEDKKSDIACNAKSYDFKDNMRF
ncbi:MAG: ankyrin repeat domain-containing protein [Alphaproteobacteria bacterium]|nr:ankyrin repeat domain-containing protein [Alphaproteobacteria bacterium]